MPTAEGCRGAGEVSDGLVTGIKQECLQN